jgi:O-antigen ligase
MQTMWCTCRKPCSRFKKSAVRNSSTMLRPSKDESGPGAVFIRVMLGFLLVYTAWAWAGLRPSFHWAGVAASGALLVGLFIRGRSAAWRAPARDPVFFLGLAFLGYLGLQWLNAGREQYFDVGYQRWMYTEPRWPGWPSAFSRPDALQMLTWFFPAWAIALAIRTRRLSRHELRGLLMLIVCNAGALAIFGLAQLASGTGSIYWVHPLQGHFFASFAYGNHAGPYFVLAGALAAGLLYQEVFESRGAHSRNRSTVRRLRPWRTAVLALMMLLCLTGANMGFSRAGVILAWMLGISVAGYGWILGWRVLSPAGRVNFTALSLAAGASLYFIVSGFGEKGIRNEFKFKTLAPEAEPTAWDRIDAELGGRPQFVRAAFEIWKEHPWFGVGGWGYKYLVADHVPENLWEKLETRGWANVHVDFLQFLAEFGIVGSGLLLGALGVMAWGLFRAPHRHDALWVMGLAGLGLIGIFSLIDLPFRCPAILYTWLVVFAMLPQLCEIRLREVPPEERPASGTAGLRICK